MENTKDGFNLQVSVLSAMLGITTPHLKHQAERLLRDALQSNPTSPVTDSSFLGRIKKLLFKPLPRKIKQAKLSCLSTSSSSVCDVPPVTPPIARGEASLPAPETPAIARGAAVKPPWEIDVRRLLMRSHYDDDSDAEDHDPTVAIPDYQDDPILSMPKGHYNSRGQRLDEDGDIVRDERVCMCEEAIYSFSQGTPHITDTYDLYALVKDFPLTDVPAVAAEILLHGVFTPKDLQFNTPAPPIVVPELDVQMSQSVKADQDDDKIEVVHAPLPSTIAPISQISNLVAHYIRTIALPPLPKMEHFTRRQRKKLLKDRGKQEKARLRQLRTFVAALKE